MRDIRIEFIPGVIYHILDGVGIPKNFFPCNGKSFYKKDYPEMIEVVKNTYMDTNEFTFTIPNTCPTTEIKETVELSTRAPENMRAQIYIYLGERA